MPELTFWENMVRLDVEKEAQHVTTMKLLYAGIIDNLNNLRNSTEVWEIKRLSAVAITQAELACMVAVKAITTPLN